MNAGVMVVDDPDFFQPIRPGDVLTTPWGNSRDDEGEAPEVPLAVWRWSVWGIDDPEDDDEPAHVLPFSRSRLSDADVNDLGVLLGELLVARWRRDSLAG
jgi:hypothetical protein